MPLYRTKGVLTGTIEPENVALAQAYLTDDDMTKYLGDNRYPTLEAAVEHIEWKLESDGHNWSVTAFTNREMTQEELEHLGSWVSGQNSDGLGEGFEQQDFAEQRVDDCGECGNCASGWGDCEEYGGMISFDWQTNNCVFERVK